VKRFVIEFPPAMKNIPEKYETRSKTVFGHIQICSGPWIQITFPSENK
jgi:hypothetical protein